jgi:DNA polymerase-3 subunit delta'
MPGLEALPETIRALRPVQTLERSLREGRVAHAIMLAGDDLPLLGQVAEGLAATLLGTGLNVDKHPDFFTLRPAKKSRAILVGKRHDAEPNTVRSLIRDLNQTANQGGYKVAVVHEVDRMNATAANAFLKTLEEPPRQTVILLLTTRPYDVMETIRSRCFQFKIPSGLQRDTGESWNRWLDDYRAWIRLLHSDPDQARRQAGRSILEAYGLLSRLVDEIESGGEAAWKQQEAQLPETVKDEEIEALKVGLQKGARDRLLIDIEEHTRLAAIELSHEVPFPAAQLAAAVASLESCTGLLALNMKDDAALEGFFLHSLRLWAQ